MLQLVIGQDKEVAAWVAARIPHVRTFGDGAYAIGVTRDNEPIGGVVYTNYREGDIEMSAAGSPGWLDRFILDVVFAYPFRQLGCRRVTTIVPKRLKAVRRFNEKVGFRLEGVIREGFPKDDAVVFGMLRRECRWLRGKDGKEQQSEAA